jgi:hypothetical protein
VSAVDSGNLAGQLLALKHACLEKIDQRPLGRAALRGIGDAAVLVRDSARSVDESRRPRSATRLRLDGALDIVMATLERVPETPAEWAGRRTITYVDPTDEDKPRLQRATIRLEVAL